MKYSQIYLLLLGLFTFNACESLLETPNPYTPEDEFLRTKEGILQSNNEQFRLLAYDKAMGGGVWLISELMSDNVDGTNLTGDWGQYYNRRSNIFNGYSRDVWKDTYAAAAEANRVLDNIDAVSGIDAETEQIIKGNCHFVRALVHFEMVRLFAQPYGFTSDNSHPGVPYRDSWNRDPLPRSTVGEVYSRIIADLEEAIALLPEVNPMSPVHADSWAAKALLAQVYFQMNEFQDAFDYADEVITMGPFAFDNDIAGRFTNTVSTEYIFYQTPGQPKDFDVGREFRENWTNGAFALSEEMVALLNEDGDLRGANWVSSGNELNKVDGNVFEHAVIHLTEIILIRAESAAELGNTGTAISDLNTIRTRAGKGDLNPGITPEELILEAQLQRRVEMIGEGARLSDMKRIAVNASPNLEIRGAIWNCPGMVVQLPDDELAGNPGMEQNPQAGC